MRTESKLTHLFSRRLARPKGAQHCLAGHGPRTWLRAYATRASHAAGAAAALSLLRRGGEDHRWERMSAIAATCVLLAHNRGKSLARRACVHWPQPRKLLKKDLYSFPHTEHRISNPFRLSRGSSSVPTQPDDDVVRARKAFAIRSTQEQSAGGSATPRATSPFPRPNRMPCRPADRPRPPQPPPQPPSPRREAHSPRSQPDGRL